MRQLLVLTVIAAALGVATPALAATRTVSITNNGFSPASVTITANDTVRWVNLDTTQHQVVSDRGAFVSPTLARGQSFSFTFRAAGTYRYRDGLKPAERGTVTVRGLPPAISLGVSHPIILFGSEVKLTGSVSSQQANESVTILAQPFGQVSWIQLAVVRTAAGGTWDYLTKPTVYTNYQVRFRSAASQPVTVQVRPKMTLRPRKRGFLYAKVTGGRSFAGHTIDLQRRTALGQWVSVARYKLGPLSGRVITWPRRRGLTTYRVFMSTQQAGGGYLESWSGTQTVRRR